MKESRRPLISPLMRWFILSMILANLAGSMYRIMLPLYISSLGASVSQVGLVFMLAALIPLFLQVFGGWLSDSIGRLRTIAIGSVGGLLGYLGMILAPNWGWITLAIGIESISQVMVVPSYAPFVAEQSSEDNRGKVFGILTTIFMVINVIGPYLGGEIVGRYDFGRLLWLGAVPYTLSFVLRMWMAWDEYRREGSRAGNLTWASLIDQMRKMVNLVTAGGALLWLFFAGGILEVITRLSNELLPLYVEQIGRLDVGQVGYLGSVFGVALMLTGIPAGRLVDRRGERVNIAAGFLLAAFGLISVLRAQTFPQIASAWFVAGIGHGLMAPAFSSLLSKIVPATQMGVIFGLYWTVRSALSLPTSWIGGQLWERFTPQLPFILVAVVAVLLSGLSFWKLSPLRNNSSS